MSGTFNDFNSFATQVVRLERDLDYVSLDSNFLSVTPAKDALRINQLIPPEKGQSCKIIIRNRSRDYSFIISIAISADYTIPPLAVVELLYDEENWWLIN